MILTEPFPLCDDIPEGTYTIRVPVDPHDEPSSIMIGTLHDEVKTTLTVKATPDLITISRTDEQELRLYDAWPSNTYVDNREAIIGVGTNLLRVTKSDEADDWTVSGEPGLTIYSPGGLAHFVKKIAGQAITKSQQQAAAQIRMPESL